METRTNNISIPQKACGYHARLVVGRVDNDYQALCLACGARGPIRKTWEEASRALEPVVTDPHDT